MGCKAPRTGTNILMEPCSHNAKGWSPLRIDDRKDEICPAALSVAFELLTFIGIGLKDGLSSFIDGKRYRSHSVRNDIAIITGHHKNFLITNITDNEVVNSMRSTLVQKSSKACPTSGKIDEQYRFRGYRLFGEARRINMDFVHIGNKKEVSVLRQCGLIVVRRRDVTKTDLLSLLDCYGTWPLKEPRHPLCYYILALYTQT